MRNPSYVTTNAREAWAARKAMAAHREANPVCAATGRTDSLHVHHVVPVSVDPDRAADPDNFITLHADAHRWIGHAGDWNQYVPNVREICMAIRVQKTVGAI